MTFSRTKCFYYGILLSRSVVFQFTFDAWNQADWEIETLIIHILQFSVIYSNWYTWICNSCSPPYTFMTFQVIECIWCSMPRNPRRILSNIEISTTRNITQQLCVNNVAIWFNRRPVNQAAIDLTSDSAPSLNISDSHRIHTAINIPYWHDHSTNLLVVDDHCMYIQLAVKLIYSLYSDNWT